MCISNYQIQRAVFPYLIGWNQNSVELHKHILAALFLFSIPNKTGSARCNLMQLFFTLLACSVSFYCFIFIFLFLFFVTCSHFWWISDDSEFQMAAVWISCYLCQRKDYWTSVTAYYVT